MKTVLNYLFVFIALVISSYPAYASSEEDIEKCKITISGIVGYPKDNLEFHGKPVKEKGYISYLITGTNRDQFFCEVYPNNQYRIKAAINAKYPFRYIGGGSFDDL